MIQIGCVLIAVGMIYAGIQGMRGQPDKHGKTTPKSVAIACFVLAAVMLVGAFVVIPMMMQDILPTR